MTFLTHCWLRAWSHATVAELCPKNITINTRHPLQTCFSWSACPACVTDPGARFPNVSGDWVSHPFLGRAQKGGPYLLLSSSGAELVWAMWRQLSGTAGGTISRLSTYVPSMPSQESVRCGWDTLSTVNPALICICSAMILKSKVNLFS